MKSGVPFDLLWDLPGIRLDGYREITRVREDGVSEQARVMPHEGAPRLSVTLETRRLGQGLEVTARARVSIFSLKDEPEAGRKKGLGIGSPFR